MPAITYLLLRFAHPKHIFWCVSIIHLVQVNILTTDSWGCLISNKVFIIAKSPTLRATKRPWYKKRLKDNHVAWQIQGKLDRKHDYQ